MNVPSSSPSPTAVATTAAATPARGAVARDGDGTGFAEVLDRSLLRAEPDREADAAPLAGHPLRTTAREPFDPTQREAQEANALPLIAAALESRALARADATASVAGEAAPGPQATAAAGASEAGARGLHGRGQVAAAPQAAGLGFADAGEELVTTAPGDLRGHQDTEPGTRAEPPPGAAAPAMPAAAAAGPFGQGPSRNPAAADTAMPAAIPAAASGTGEATQLPRRDAAPLPTHDPVAATTADALSLAGAPTVPVAAGPTTLPATGAAPAVPPAPAQGFVAPEVASRAWGQALGHEVARLHHAGQGHAQLELNPPGLGPLSVTLSVADQLAQAAFTSPHAAVRAAIEAALPQLRNALAESGISLGQASVGAEHRSGGGASAQQSHDQAPQRRQDDPSFQPQHAALLPLAPRRDSAHMLDTFA